LPFSSGQKPLFEDYLPKRTLFRPSFPPKKFKTHYPLVYFDVTPVHLVSETRKALPMKVGKPERWDYEYGRAMSISQASPWQ
jgi:hypothetical protein